MKRSRWARENEEGGLDWLEGEEEEEADWEWDARQGLKEFLGKGIVEDGTPVEFWNYNRAGGKWVLKEESQRMSMVEYLYSDPYPEL